VPSALFAAAPAFRRGAVAAALLAAASALSPAPLAAQEEGVFELRLTAVPQTRTVAVLLDARGEPMLPLLELLEYLEIPVTREAGALLLEWPPGVWSTRVDLAERSVRTGSSTRTVAAEEWVRRGEEIFLSVAEVERLLAGTLRVDWENVGIVVTGRDDYPLVRRLRAAGRRLSAPGRHPEDHELDVPYPARSGGATLGWGVSTSMAGERVTGSARAALGLALAGGSLEGGATVRMDETGTRPADPYLRYGRAFPRGRWLRQVEAGDVHGEGLVRRPFFGVALSNTPLYAPHHFGEMLVRPAVPAGWEYEVYQGDHLIGISTRGAAEPVSAPVGYGTTPVRVRMIGPAGQERVEEVVFLVPAVQVPAGEWRWALGGGACRGGGCTTVGYADLRRGVTPTLTVGAGVDHTTTDSASTARPYAVVSWTPLPPLRAELRARPGALVHASLHRYHRYGGVRLGGGRMHEEGGYRLPAPVWFGEGSAAVRTPLPGRGRVLTLFARGREGAEGARERWQAGFTSGFRAVHLGAAYERGHQAHPVLTVQGGAPLPRHLLPTLRNPTLNARLDLAGGALHAAALGTSFRPVERASVNAALTWYAGGAPPGFALSVVTRTPAAYLQTHGFSERGRHGGYASASGGVAFGHTGNAVTTPWETIGRGGVTGVVFFDDDGDGVWGGHEEVARGVPVIVGGERAVTDERGVFRAWGLLPYRALSLAVDTLSLAVTGVSAARPEHLLRVTPNIYVRHDLPLVRTREAAGRLRWEGAPGALGGVTIEARAASGTVHRAVTFSDGEFYFPRLPAGEYVVTVAESSLRALRASASQVALAVPGTAGSATVAIPPLLLRPGG
jgi:hypothetical protein